MEKEKELNGTLKAEISEKFDSLFRKIGNNRQQLANKVIAVRHTLLKELSKEKVDAGRQAAILREVAEVERMAAKQLPHGEMVHRHEASPVEPKPPVKVEPKVAPKPEVKPAAVKQEPAPKSKPKAPAAKAPAAKAKAPAKSGKKK